MPSGGRAAISEVAEIVMGQSPPGSTYNDQGKGLPFFQGKAEFGEVSPTAVKWCTDPRRTAEPGDILMSVRAPVGPTNLATERCCIGRGLAAIRADSRKLEPTYLQYFLRYSEPRLAGLGQGSTFSAIGRAEIASLAIPLPSLEDQRRVADLLSRAENIVRMRREAERKAKEIIPALFLDMFGDPANSARIGYGGESTEETLTKTIGSLLEEGYLLLHKDGNHGSLYPSPHYARRR
jgi:type I restriction enzyme S subunit